MSTCRQLWQFSAVLAGLSLAGLTAEVSADEAVGRLATYDKAPGESYFALSVMPKVAADAGQKNDVVILFDTSASQAGAVRSDAMAALAAMLKGLGPNDRVKLMAVDVKAAPMTDGFVAADSPELQAGLAKLQQRAPLGATDLDAGLRAAAASLADAPGAKTAVYLGDGLSKANVLDEATFGQLTDDLVKARVTVSSLAIGHDRNVQVLAALANHTGGVVALDNADAAAPATAGTMLAGSIHGGVIWPTKSELPASITESFPANMPPLRTDRDSIVIGKLANSDAGDLTISGDMNGQPVELVAKVSPEKPSEDFAFLPKLVELAQTDKGLSLPTLGSAGLREAAAVTMTSAEQLAKLGHEALAAGNVAGATKVAEAALARDPKNPEALAVREAARKLAASGGRGAPPARAAAEPDLKLARFDDPASAPAAGSLLEEVLAEKPGFITDVEKQREVLSGKIRAEVENGLNAARKTMGESPAIAEQDLKVLMESVERSPDLDAEVRGQLREQIENAIRQARQQKLVVDEAQARAEEAAGQAREFQRINDQLALDQMRLKQVMDRFTSLMAEGRFDLADQEVIPEVLRLARDTPISASVMSAGRFQRNYEEMRDLWRRREDGFLRTMYQVEQSHVPFPDEPPIVYPDAQWWEQISIDRKRKYASMDLLKTNSSESRIYEQLNKPTNMEFVETPLKDAIDFLANQHEIPIVLNAKKLEEAGVNIDTPVTKNLKGITLRSALRLMLSELELTYMVKDEVLQITTPEDAESPDNMVTKVYNVGDLVVPIQNNQMFGIGGFAGGVGGGMMGGGMGGMGGGMMGGMGGGMGGMGGGMGGMGGGFFAVEDDLSLGSKKPAAAPVAAPVTEEPQLRRPAGLSLKTSTSKSQAPRINVEAAAGETSSDAWDRYFGEQAARLSSSGDSPAIRHELLASVRETVRQLMYEKNYGEVPVLIQSALRNGIIESWMYEAMGLAMQADQAPAEELERALMSAVDLASSPEEVMFIASYMDQAGLHQRALSLCRQLGRADPNNPQPFMQGLALAQRLGDREAIRWASTGILSQAWTSDESKVPERAYRVAQATYEELLAEGKQDEAKAFDQAVRAARRRDCLVVVTWTGDADIDLSVEEPAGTICSTRQPRTTSGGVHMGDVASTEGNPGNAAKAAKGLSEAYVCSEAFDGIYRVLLKNVWGRPTSGKVTIDIYTNFGTDQQRVIHEQIPLAEKNALVEFEVKDGRRKDALPEAQVATIAKAQNAVNKQILAQQLAGLDDTQAARDFALALAMAGGNNGNRPFFRRGAVGYRPQIDRFPEGAGFQATAVISADRRYVRVSPMPFFSQINEVSTFNFVTGQGGQQGGQQGGGGGVGFGGAGGFGGGGQGGGGGFF
jgi:hypothetical protein